MKRAFWFSALALAATACGESKSTTADAFAADAAADRAQDRPADVAVPQDTPSEGDARVPGGDDVADRGAGDAATSPPGTRDSGPEGPRTDARVGIATRPANPTCKPPAAYDQPAEMLSNTGCVDPSDPTRPAPGLIPFDVASPLWSDGAAKERFVALPDNATIHVKDCTIEPTTCQPVAAGGTSDDDGHFTFPVGTVLMKTFVVGGKRIETRLLVRFNETRWVGYSYEWNAAQTDARVFHDQVGGVKKPIASGSGTQEWLFPSRSECFQCHTRAAGVSLGPELKQLNRDYMYPSGIGSNQLATWEAIGLFDRPLRRPLPAVLPTPTGTSAVGLRARSYLHANCAICHRPEGNFPEIDLRFATALHDTNLCNVPPDKGTTGVAGALRLVPGQPARSVLALRMRHLGEFRMPQLATSVVDMAGVAAVEDWIRSLSACP